MKKLFLLVIVFVAAAFFVGCDNPEASSGQATVYGAVSYACPIKVSVKVDGDGKVLEAEINEYLSLYDVGRLEQRGEEWYKYGEKINEQVAGYAKFVRVGEMNFVFDGAVYSCAIIEGEDKSFDGYVSTEDGSKRYIECVQKGEFFITDGVNPYGVPFDEYDGYCLDKSEWADKMKNGFHEGVEYENGYKENIYKLVTHVKNHGLYDYTGEEMPQGKDGTFKVGKYDTLVNLSNFHEYMQLIKAAYEKAVAVTD